MIYKEKYYTIELHEQSEQQMNTPGRVIEFIREDMETMSEVLMLVGMNTKNKVMFKKTIVIGVHNTLIVKPADIFRPLIAMGLSNFIVAHNHPSGTTEPSNEDIVFTKKLLKATNIMGLNFLDHLIIADGEHYSFKANGMI